MTSNLLERETALGQTVATPSPLLETHPHSLTPPTLAKQPLQTSWSIMTWATVGSLLVASFGGGWWVANKQASRHERMSLPESDLI